MKRIACGAMALCLVPFSPAFAQGPTIDEVKAKIYDAKALKQTSPSAAQAARSFDQRWSAWGSAFGGTGTTKGDPLIGSSNVAASDYGSSQVNFD